MENYGVNWDVGRHILVEWSSIAGRHTSVEKADLSNQKYDNCWSEY